MTAVDIAAQPRNIVDSGPALNKRTRSRIQTGVISLLVIGWLVLTLGPYIVMLLTSLTPREELIAPGATLLPGSPSLDGYRDLFASTDFVLFLRNSAIVAAGTVALSLICASFAAIGLSRFRFRGRSTLLTSLLIAQLFPAVLLVIPLQQELRTFGLLDNLLGLIFVNTTFATPFATWLLKGFLDSIPAQLDEAARIDGATGPQMIRYVLFPLMRPGMTAAGTYAFIYSWNEFLYALTFTKSPQTNTIPIGLQLMIGEYQIRWDLLTAGGVLAALPVLIGFMLVQRNLIDGLTAGAVKG
ncbi:carbohydrate ABC transporter permease [Propionimicrobium sp. PCR01-08-3]|uniref:carbohydrate ABC transporter permease n=1 Tax=Propionimicrobium sp. PCR01-08-3 TaxID=3052086 RepID=UPI00255CF3B4|nr:carbohydrate ABC transporter permease [Propionimicrobium sp. PCR01-08-3]WIY83483.1 carbohydrate ABC transporter permease [Propionimicrobium sp. PCR01-08-3]